MATTTPTTQAIARPSPVKTIFDMLEKSREQIAMALPAHMTPERMLRVARTAISKTTRLQECTPISILGSVIEASQLGLEPDGILGNGYLVPTRNKKTGQMECAFRPGYRGLIQLALRSGLVSFVAAELVFDCDKFSITYAPKRELFHSPDLDNEVRGAKDEKGHLVGLRGAYALIQYKDGTTDFEYMSRMQLQKIRSRSEAVKNDVFSPWVTDEDEMFRKCPIRRGAKRWPLSPEFQRAAVKDEYEDAGVDTGGVDPEFVNSEVARLATEQSEARLLEKYKPEDESQEQPESAENPQPPSQESQPEAPATASASQAPESRHQPRSRNSGKSETSGVPLGFDR